MSPRIQILKDFYRGRRVALTGHTGLKGSWLALWLHDMGAEVLGIALPPESELSLFSACHLDRLMASHLVDIRDLPAMQDMLARFKPEVVFHLAAQAIVGLGYEDPRSTFETNVLGTVNVLECVRRLPSVKAVVLASSDKCYRNVEQMWGYREIDPLGGDDPYSASKAAAEMAIHAYDVAYFRQTTPPSTASVASVRAGNVVGGGDWSKFRLVPDCIRSLREGRKIVLRNPTSTRPWQFVLDPLAGYLELARRLATEGHRFAGAWNFGPPVDTATSVAETAKLVIAAWGGGEIELADKPLFAEHRTLQLDCTKARLDIGWRPNLDLPATIEYTTDWYRRQFDGRDGDMLQASREQIAAFEELNQS